MTKSLVVWITGVSGSGKTTIGSLVKIELQKVAPVILLDGDELREVYGNDLGYSYEERLQVAMRNSRLCKLISEQGFFVICTTISLFHDCHSWNRQNIKNYKEIFLDVPTTEIVGRDPKRIYQKAFAQKDVSNIVGFGVACEKPMSPDLIISNYGDTSPHNAVAQIMQEIGMEQQYYF